MRKPDEAPDDAAELQDLLTARFGESFDVAALGLHAQALAALRLIASQVSHRQWTAQAVPAETVRLLAACALAAPSKSDLQQADIIDVRDPGRRAALQELVPTLPWLHTAPALLVFCANGRRFRRLFDRRGMAFANDHLDAFFNPVVDAALVMMNFITAARAIGLVTCPISLIRNAPRRVASILELPDRVVPVAGLCAGYPARSLAVRPRLPLSATVHIDGIGERDDDADCDAFDARYVQARNAVLPPEAQPARPWSDERSDQYAAGQRADWGAFVRSAGFDLS